MVTEIHSATCVCRPCVDAAVAALPPITTDDFDWGVEDWGADW